MAESKMVPQLRFRGFTGDWEQRKWSETVDISTEMVDPTSGEYDDMPHIAPGNIESFTGRILDNVKSVKEEQLISGKFRFRPGDVVYGKINPQLGKYFYASVDGLTSADAYVFNGKNGVTQKFLFSLLQTEDFFKYSVSVSKRSGMPKINRDELNAYSFLAPNEKEQERIGDFLLGIDNLITLHQRKYNKLLALKKSMLEKMFPKTGSDVPEIRFAGFTGAWEQRKVGEVIEDYVEKTTVQNQYPVLTSSQQQGIVLQEDYFADRQVTTNDNVGYFVLPRGYFTYRSRSDTDLFVFNRNSLIDKGIISYYYPVFRPKNADSNFLLRRLNYGIRSQLSMAAEGTGQHVLAHSKFKNMEFLVPPLQEQKLIGAYFEKLDDLITLHQRKYEKLKQIKQSMLEKMFV